MIAIIRSARVLRAAWFLAGCIPLLGTPPPSSSASPHRIEVDARHAPQRIVRVRQTCPAQPGPLDLLYPQWIPGEHAPNGPAADLVSFRPSSRSQLLDWKRDPLDPFRIRILVPPGAESVDLDFEVVLPGRPGFTAGPSTSPNLAMLNWNLMLLYPAQLPADSISFAPALRLPPGWRFGTALTVRDQMPDRVEFDPVPLTILIDSPVLAGAGFRTIDLAPAAKIPHLLHLAADSKAALEIRLEDVEALRRLIDETGSLFGSRPYRHYHFLLALSDQFSQMSGLEHRESTDIRMSERSLVDPSLRRAQISLLPHEMIHAWNGKYRLPAGMLRDSYNAPIDTRLLWIYEGLTSYLTYVLAARSGLWPPETARDRLALAAATLEHRRGRAWRTLEDTAAAAPILFRAGQAWAARRRSVDFYQEGALTWLAVDVRLRQLTHHQRSLDDFCRRFFGRAPSSPPALPYALEDVIRLLEDLAPSDWRGFFRDRIESPQPHLPLDELRTAGWMLAFTPSPPEIYTALETAESEVNATFSIGLLLDPGGQVRDVIPESPADQAGLAPGMAILGIDGRRWSKTRLSDALLSASRRRLPIELLVENGDSFLTRRLDSSGGPRYPCLERVPEFPDLLGRIFQPRGSAGSSSDR